MREYKIVVLGTMGAGKSTLVGALASGRAVNTDVANTDSRSLKTSTTVAMDYADIDLPNGDRLRLYGTPGQHRFDFILPILLEGATGAIVLMDGHFSRPADSASFHLSALNEYAPGIPAVVGLTKLDTASEAQAELCSAWLRGQETGLPAMMLDARDAHQVITLMDMLMGEIEAAALVSAGE